MKVENLLEKMDLVLDNNTELENLDVEFKKMNTELRNLNTEFNTGLKTLNTELDNNIKDVENKISNLDSKKSNIGHYHNINENCTVLSKGNNINISGTITLTDNVHNYKALIINTGDVSGGKNTSSLIYPFNFGFGADDGNIRDVDEMYCTFIVNNTAYRYYFKPTNNGNSLYFELRDSNNNILSSNPDSRFLNIRYIAGIK